MATHRRQVAKQPGQADQRHQQPQAHPQHCLAHTIRQGQHIRHDEQQHEQHGHQESPAHAAQELPVVMLGKLRLQGAGKGQTAEARLQLQQIGRFGVHLGQISRFHPGSMVMAARRLSFFCQCRPSRRRAKPAQGQEAQVCLPELSSGIAP